MEDYKEEMTNLFLKHYSNKSENPEAKPIQRTTKEIWDELKGVIPTEPIDEHEVYEMLKEQGFQQGQKIEYEKVCIISHDCTKLYNNSAKCIF